MSATRTGGDWTDISASLSAIVGDGAAHSATSMAIAQANSLAAQAAFFTPVVPQPGTPALALSPADGGTVVRAFWWGFHVEIGHDDLETILKSADMVNATVAAIGGNIPSPAAPWIKLLAPFVAAVHERLRAMDRGCGIYVSMSWFAPGVFIPTSVPC
ncbi:hypothetical protein [Nonomuraea sp. NPDC049625]|uniref:hypothetical protein n=1 Tax=Nonomuraea sp. NPDC049625 TaxID=3155775 RepID=UPI003434FE3B